MRATTKLQVRWDQLLPLLVHDDCVDEQGNIKYEPFLETFQVQYGTSILAASILCSFFLQCVNHATSSRLCLDWVH